MKKLILFFLCMLGSLIQGQAQYGNTKFPFGVYTYGSLGLNVNSIPWYEETTASPDTIGLATLWRDSLFINAHVSAFDRGWGSSDNFANFTNYADWFRGKARFNNAVLQNLGLYWENLQCFTVLHNQPGIFHLAQGQYLKVTKSDTSINQTRGYDIIQTVKSDGELSIAPLSSSGFYVKPHIDITKKQIVKSIQIHGTVWNDTYGFTNLRSLRPWTFNTVEGSNTDTVKFYLRLSYKLHTTKADEPRKVYFKLLNQHWAPNDNPDTLKYDENLSPGTHTVQMNVFLKKNHTTENSDAYFFTPRVSIHVDLAQNDSLEISDITLFDSLGIAIMENDYLSTMTANKVYDYKTLVQSYISAFNSPGYNQEPIIYLGEEITIGSFAVNKKIATQFSQWLPSAKFFICNIEGIDPVMMTRLLQEMNTSKLIFAPDIYPFIPSDDITCALKYDTILTRRLIPELSNIRNTVQNLPSLGIAKPTLHFVPQAHQWLPGQRLPTIAETIAIGYLGILFDFKGLWYYQCLAENRDGMLNFYKKWDKTLATNSAFLSQTTNLLPHAKIGAKSVGAFLHTRTIDDTLMTVGDILVNSKIEDLAIVGDNSVYQKDCNLHTLANRFILERIELIDTLAGGTGNGSAEEGLLGVGIFSYNGNDNLLFTNLDFHLRKQKVRLTLRTSQSKFLRVTDIANNHIYNRIYPANATILVDIPSKGAVILKIENVNENPITQFSKGIHFGVQRIIDPNTTRVILDTNFASTGGVSEEFEFDIPGTNNKIFAEDFSLSTPSFIQKDSLQDLGVFTWSYTNNQIVVNYDFYLQGLSNARGSRFSKGGRLSINTQKNYNPSDFPNNSLDVFPLVGDWDNDGITNFGYAIRNSLQNRFEVVMPGYDTAFYADSNYSESGQAFLMKKNNSYRPGFYANGYFSIKLNDLGTMAHYPYWISNDINIPLVGDWANNSDTEYGLYAIDNFYGLGFRLNHSNGTDPWSWFEFQYGDPGDKPIVWEPSRRIGDTSQVIIHLSALLEGLYNTSSNTMTTDTISAYLALAGAPYQFIDSCKAVLNSAGMTDLQFNNITNDTLLYLVIKHRNAIETWSANPLMLHRGVPITYNFTVAADMAFGNNQVAMDSVWCIYSGDVNQDGTIDFSDVVLIQNDADNFIEGYVATDVNGDLFVDFSDLTIADNNSLNFVSTISPVNSLKKKHIRFFNNKSTFFKKNH